MALDSEWLGLVKPVVDASLVSSMVLSISVTVDSDVEVDSIFAPSLL